MSQAPDSARAKPRLLFYLPALGMGGAERHTLDLRARFAELGYPTRLIVHGSTISPALEAVPGAKGAEVLGLPRMSDFKRLPQVRRAFRAADADVVFCVNQSSAIWAVLLRLVGGTKGRVACVFHTTIPGREDRSTLAIFRVAARLLDVLVYVSRNQQDYWRTRKLKARSDRAIVNGVELERFQPSAGARMAARERLKFTADDYAVGLVASFRPEKNHAELVRAADRLRGEGLACKVVFVGDGGCRPQIQEQVAALGIQDHVVFVGECDDVRTVIPALDVGVLCSTEVETFSLAALELLASGVPMVMTDIGGASEIVEPGVNGFLYPPGDVDALVHHLTELARPEVRMPLRENARGSVRRYSIEAMMRGYVGLVDELITGSRYKE